MNSATSFIKSYRFLQIVTGTMYIFMAVLALRYTPNSLIESIRIFGVFSLIKGVFEILNRANIKKRTHHNQYSSLLLGVVDILVGIIMIVNTSLNLVELSMLFGIWFIGDAVISFFLLDLAKKISESYYYISLVIYLIGSVIGLMLLVAGDTTIVTAPVLISIYFLLFGFVKLIGGMLNRRDIHVTN
ncbi:HdeD family acid-resistance protein [Enterococcus ureasiticus]|uniref:DUF308 domain-containing protein n=1 Tax=Enterococcus ureasiticus TaxID=903984 RepID=A0A1E5GC04_9ENTE|nr:DUF308 domain-containing protein [Enterococcus ureasiticus]OEG10266.1 hypothetical protein BCR21_13015 [Enterococcus ureasiticus]